MKTNAAQYDKDIMEDVEGGAKNNILAKVTIRLDFIHETKMRKH